MPVEQSGHTNVSVHVSGGCIIDIEERMYLLSSCPLPDISESGRKDSVSSVKGLWGSSAVLHTCNACYSALNA